MLRNNLTFVLGFNLFHSKIILNFISCFIHVQPLVIGKERKNKGKEMINSTYFEISLKICISSIWLLLCRLFCLYFWGKADALSGPKLIFLNFWSDNFFVCLGFWCVCVYVGLLKDALEWSPISLRVVTESQLRL